MNVQDYVEQTYGVTVEHPFSKDLATGVFRHQSNRKWFAVFMEIPPEKLGLSGSGNIRVMNVKCDTRLIGSFREGKGIFPAYHMSRAHWLTVLLDGTVADDTLRFLLDMSYDLTKGNTHGKGNIKL